MVWDQRQRAWKKFFLLDYSKNWRFVTYVFSQKPGINDDLSEENSNKGRCWSVKKTVKVTINANVHFKSKL